MFPATINKAPPIHDEALTLSQHHLKLHGLDPEQAATLPPIAFDLPPLQGEDLSQHFWNLGRHAAQPWLGMAHNLANVNVFETLPEGVMELQEEASEDEEGVKFSDWLALDPSIRAEFRSRPPKWLKKAGWVRYPVLTSTDGKAKALGDGHAVDFPNPEDGSLVFDVECMVQESHFAVMATAAGPKAWYVWLSPWLLQEGERCHEKDHLIPFGPKEDLQGQPARLIVGHNVSFDRARIQDEYSLDRGNIRFLDTMSLHVATRGISSPQRGAWMKYSKSRALENMLSKDEVEDEKKRVITAILGGEEVDPDVLSELDLDDVVQHGSSSQSFSLDLDSNGSPSQSLLWQDVTSNNSLADVAKLHCGIDISKESRDVFVDGTPREEIVNRLDELLSYCATDVITTHKVFKKVWSAFTQNCPNPVTTAGILGLGSAILPVDDEWVDYIKRCEEHYESSLQEVRETLIQLAEQLRQQGSQNITWDQALEAAEVHGDPSELEGTEHLKIIEHMQEDTYRPKLWWETDPWASQLDWTPKKPKKARIINSESRSDSQVIPRWYRDKVLKSPAGVGTGMALTPILLRLHRDNQPIVKREDGKWVTKKNLLDDGQDILGSPLRKDFLKRHGNSLESRLGPQGTLALESIIEGSSPTEIRAHLRKAADELVLWSKSNQKELESDMQLRTLDWTPVDAPQEGTNPEQVDEAKGVETPGEETWWPKWYWDLYKSATGQLELTVRSKVAPLLLRLTWQRCPLHHSREHGWVFRYDPQSEIPLYTRQKPLQFKHPADFAFREDIKSTVTTRLAGFATNAGKGSGRISDPASITPVFYKIPHVAGDGSNVGSPFSKGFIPLFEKGTLQSEHPDERGRIAAKRAVATNARCSYWIGVRDRVDKQMVVWNGESQCDMHFEKGASGARQDKPDEDARRKGIILPQVVPMGTVTRRAIEKTWLTASNAKPNRVGSELKAMVKAPPGWSIVGADVDSQELWICSVMGDAQFGFHGATAVGWMTLEGSKSLGTDLHSKTAQILGTDRNQAKVFNYSRIYGAGIRHSSQLLLKASPDMSPDEATRKAKELYASTKGKNTYSDQYFGRRFWYGGTESYVFNKLEEIALQDQPKTPALDCGVTAALTRKYLPKPKRNGPSSTSAGEDYMPSRINWVVQSSGVDYLHLLITAMEYLIAQFGLRARFMLSVHDEVRYLARDEDTHRVALALQIANLWTRAMFAHKLHMDSLPQGVGFFAQIDVDKVLRKEADDPCVTPSHPEPIPAGKAFDIYETLQETHGGSLYADGRPMKSSNSAFSVAQKPSALSSEGIDCSTPSYKPSRQTHRSIGDRGLRFLQAQASDNVHEIAALEERVQMMEQQAASAHQPKVHASNEKTFGARGARQTPFKKASQSPLMSYGFHTSASPAALPPNLFAIVQEFPPKPVKLRVPFFKTASHRIKMRWQIYRELLRRCPASYVNLRWEIQSEMRRQRHNTSMKRTAKLEEKAKNLLRDFQKESIGNDRVSKALARYNKDLSKKHEAQQWKESFDAYHVSLQRAN